MFIFRLIQTHSDPPPPWESPKCHQSGTTEALVPSASEVVKNGFRKKASRGGVGVGVKARRWPGLSICSIGRFLVGDLWPCMWGVPAADDLVCERSLRRGFEVDVCFLVRIDVNVWFILTLTFWFELILTFRLALMLTFQFRLKLVLS